MGIPVEKIHVIENISQETISLEQPVGDDDDKSTLENFIPDDKILRPDQESSRRILSDQIREVLDELNPKERKILEMRYGLTRWHSTYSRESGGRIRCHSRTYSPN